mmetsp:Transcript_4722/g.9957  ORF Transcript_4722/g.9957 Transcript_4722/m.9957 type:complete len:201 (+) Transcript_4722:125-727(+)|eukprot:CAMPEP_0194324652 /NCGR_PEP_ID=MMETSP0171-20130528/28779_1 /TAXON_ID=218684 /ORGANISM="Corethron pennatum, Strain L29A3" /LENGTH=200 /DNA_ID=CAMNT_0039083603 /DNA_START=40 /DNA_END=645 /DNA_ORIENTATION=-
MTPALRFLRPQHRRRIFDSSVSHFSRPTHKPFYFHRQLSSSNNTDDDFFGHTLNCEKALMKRDEGRPFSELIREDISALQGIGPKAVEVLHGAGVRTIEDLATYKYFHVARSVTQLARTGAEGGVRVSGSVMNIDRAVDKAFESKRFSEISQAPLSALQGLSEEGGSMWKELGVVTVQDLSELKYFQWAESMVLLSKYEK